MRRFVFFVGIVVSSTLALSQNSATDSWNLRALLEEVRQFHRDLQTATVATQRVQIALYRLQLQDSTVARATKLVEDAKSQLAELVAERKRATVDMERAEDRRTRTQDPHERQVIEEEDLPQFKRHLEQLANHEEQWQARANEAERKLRAEQVKLNALHNQLDQLDQALQNVGHTSEAAVPPEK